MTKNIQNLMNEKHRIYDAMLNLLEQKARTGGSSNIINNVKIIGNININPVSETVILSNRLKNLNGLTLSQAMEDSFSRISKK
jgi:hypothetical protein